MNGLRDMAGVDILPADGAALKIGPGGIFAVVQFSDFLQSEIDALRRGKLDIALLGSGATGFLVTRFTSLDGKKPPIDLEMPFHLGTLPLHQRHLPERPDGKVWSLTIILQDSHGRGHGGRLVSIEPALCDAIAALVRRQMTASASPAWSRRVHDQEVEDFYRRYPDSRTLVDKVFPRALARMTIN